MKKRIVSLLLVFSLLFSGAITVFAEDTTEVTEVTEEENVTEQVTGLRITQYDYGRGKEFDVLVICFDSKYSVKGEAPTVSLEVYYDGKNDGTPNYTSGIGRVTQELFVYEGVNYPQIFVTVPIDFVYKDARTYITIQEGVYETAEGEKSRKVEIPYTLLEADPKRDRISLTCKGDAVTRKDTKPVWVLQNSTVSAEGSFNCEYADMWMANSDINFYHNDSLLDTTENRVIAENSGNYKVEFRLNDQLRTEKYFLSIDKTNRYFDNLGEKTEVLLLSPITFIVSLVMFIFVPGFGTWIGSTAMLASIYTIPNFFIALFGMALSGEYTF